MSMRVSGPPWVVNMDPTPLEALVSGAGISYASTSALAATVQSSGAAAIAAGTTLLDETLLLGSNTNLTFQPGTTLQSTGTRQHTLIRTGNAEFLVADGALPGVSIYCHDEVTTAGTGTLRYTHATTSLAWLAPGESVYGAEVNIGAVVDATTIGIFVIPGASAGKQLYAYVAPTLAGAVRAGVMTHRVRVEPVTGAKAMTWTRAGNVRTVTEAAHGRRVGDFVINFGPTGNVRHGYIGAVTLNTYTMPDTGADQAVAQTGRAYGVRNITINGNGAKLDFRKGALPVAMMSNLHAVILNACSDVTVSGIEVSNTTKYALWMSGYKNIRVSDFRTFRDVSSDLSGNSDVIHPLGPGRGLYVNGVRAQGGDNLLGVGCSDIYDYILNCPQYGDLSLIGGEMWNAWCEDTDEQPVRFYNANGSVIRRWTIGPVQGTYAATVDACVAVIMDSMTDGTGVRMVDSGATNVDDITIISPDAVRSDGSASYAFVNRGAGTRTGIRLLGVKPRASTAAARATCWIEGGSRIEDLYVDFLPGTFSGHLVAATGTGSFGRVKVSCAGKLVGNNQLGGGHSPSVVSLDDANASIDYLDVSDLVVDDSSSSGTKISVVINKGTIKDRNYSNIRVLNGDAVERGSSTASYGSTHVLRARNVTYNSAFGFVFDAGVPADVRLDAVLQQSAGNALFTVNEATGRAIRIHANGCKAGNRFLRNVQGGHGWSISGSGNETGGGGGFVVDAGGPSVKLTSDWDLPIDGALLTATIGDHKAGAKFYNSNAAYGAGVGTYVRGATTWTRVAA